MTYPTVTFADFGALMRARGIGAEYLIERFRGPFGTGDGQFAEREPVRRFFERVFEGRHGAVVVPYRSVLDFYQREIATAESVAGIERRCGCGCGQRIFGRKVYAAVACRKRAERSRDSRKRPEKCPPLLGQSVTFRGGRTLTPPGSQGVT